MKSDNVGRTV